MDKRLGSLREVKELHVEAQASNCKLNVFDVDAPLEMSLLGVLLRNPGGADPIVPYDVISGGFKAARGQRSDIIKCYKDNPGLGRYELYQTLPDGSKKKVLDVESGAVRILDEDGYAELVSDPKNTLNNNVSKVIDDAEIDRITRDLPESDFKKAAIETLQNNKGKTWSQAVSDHGKV